MLVIETLAISEGIRIALQMKMANITVKSDSQVAIFHLWTKWWLQRILLFW